MAPNDPFLDYGQTSGPSELLATSEREGSPKSFWLEKSGHGTLRHSQHTKRKPRHSFPECPWRASKRLAAVHNYKYNTCSSKGLASVD